MRILRILLALLIFNATGAPILVSAIIEHMAGDDCCATGCDVEDCDDCACCLHVRPILAQVTWTAERIATVEPASAEPRGLVSGSDPREILHVPRPIAFA